MHSDIGMLWALLLSIQQRDRLLDHPLAEINQRAPATTSRIHIRTRFFVVH